jgi:hypothetical protein
VPVSQEGIGEKRGLCGQPTGKKLPDRRKSSHVVPVPMARRRGPQQQEMELEDMVTENVLVNEIRQHVDQWRRLRKFLGKQLKLIEKGELSQSNVLKPLLRNAPPEPLSFGNTSVRDFHWR